MKTYQKEIKLRTFEFALSALRGCRKVAETEKEFIVTRQLARSATSVGANVREARNAVSKNDFINKMAIAQKECDESMYWLELLTLSWKMNTRNCATWKKKLTKSYWF